MRITTVRWLYLAILALVWGSSFILMKKALIGLTPIQVGALRILITAFVLILVGYNHLFSIKNKYYVDETLILLTPFDFKSHSGKARLLPSQCWITFRVVIPVEVEPLEEWFNLHCKGLRIKKTFCFSTHLSGIDGENQSTM